MRFIDINCDMGENRGDDAAVIKFVSSANIACGGHAGDTETMKRTIELALKAGVKAGAHPGYDDPENFGRIETGASTEEIIDDVLCQIHRFKNITEISHIKFHGALYNRAAADFTLMTELVKSIVNEFGRVPFFTLAGSASEKAVANEGCILLREGFTDRAYDDAGCLVPRTIEGAVLHDVDFIAGRVLDIAAGRPILSINGRALNLDVDTICVHGDTPGAVEMAAGIYSILGENGIIVRRTDAL